MYGGLVYPTPKGEAVEKDINKSSLPQRKPVEYFQMALNAIKEITGLDTTSDEEARLFIEAGKMCDLSGDWLEALESYQQALALCEGDDVRAEALKQMGHNRSRRCEWKVALENYEASVNILNKLGDLCEVGNIYNSIGFNCFETGNMDDAKEYYDRALQIAQQCRDTQLGADVQSNLGILSTVKGQPEEALKKYQESLLGYEACGDIHGLAQVYHNLAMAYTNIEEWRLAGEHYQKSMELCIEIGDMDLLSIIYTNRAKLALYLHDPLMAETYCDKAFKSLSKTGNKMGEAEVHKLYGIVYSDLQQWDSAVIAFQKGIEICNEYDNHLTKAEILHELGSMIHRRDQKDEALRHLKKSLEIYKSMGIDEEASKIRDEIQMM